MHNKHQHYFLTHYSRNFKEVIYLWERFTLRARALRRTPACFSFKSSNASFTDFFIRFRSSWVFLADGIISLMTSQGRGMYTVLMSKFLFLVSMLFSLKPTEKISNERNFKSVKGLRHCWPPCANILTYSAKHSYIPTKKHRYMHI